MPIMMTGGEAITTTTIPQGDITTGDMPILMNVEILPTQGQHESRNCNGTNTVFNIQNEKPTIFKTEKKANLPNAKRQNKIKKFASPDHFKKGAAVNKTALNEISQLDESDQ